MIEEAALPPDRACLSPSGCISLTFAASAAAEAPAEAAACAAAAAADVCLSVEAPGASKNAASLIEAALSSSASTATEEASVSVTLEGPVGSKGSFCESRSGVEQQLSQPSSTCSSSTCSTKTCSSSTCSSTCTLTAVLKRQALLAAIGRLHSTRTPNPQLKTTTSAVLHFIALLLSFVMLVALWGVLDVVVEVLAGPNSLKQLQGYAALLFVGLLLTFLLKFIESQGRKLTIYPTLIVSLVTVVAAWGIIDGVVEVAARGHKHYEGFIYAAFFIASAVLVSLHTCFCNRSFSVQLRRFVCY